MASAAREGAGSGRRRPPPRRALPGLLLLCLWLPGGRAAGSPSAPLSELHAQLSGVEQLLEEFRRQLQQERPQEELELELRASGDPQEGCPGPGGGGYRARPDAIIRTKDSIAAGASFLSAPAAVRDWRQCLQACCLEPRCSVAVVELPRRLAPPAAALGCYLFNCTWRGHSVCKFALHRGYSSYSLSRAPEGEQEGLEAVAPALARASPRLVSAGREMETHTTLAQPRTPGPGAEAGRSVSPEKSEKSATPKQTPELSTTEKKNHSTFGGPESHIDLEMPDGDSSGKNRKEENYIFESKSNRGGGEHPAPEAGAVLPLALGLAITALLLLMVACRLRLVKQKLKQARPITSEESDYLINGMYL
ncbi:hypothetical protein FD754_009769 [Muntiacus muntjak]|uniref:MANSC domain-containing protein n=1 Tax=Muntiacus muntjak TaxID=9888 RepID=A0A5N3WW51_MUNMU|nr:hypothetical protein FD754_009769 [Muntiacus muntjak]